MALAEQLAALNSAPATAAKQSPQWLLFNDFAISHMPAAEVRRQYDGQKVPVLLYYTKVSPTTRKSSNLEVLQLLSR